MPLYPEIYCTAAQAAAAWPQFATLPQQEQTDLICDASLAVQNYVRRNLLQQTFDEFYDGTNLPRIWLRVRPVIAVTAVLINGDALDNTYQSAWYFNPDTGELGRGDGQDDKRFPPWFPTGSCNIEVVYAAGYATVPGPVKRATIMTIHWLYDAGRRSWLYASERIGDYQYTVNTDIDLMILPPSAAALLTAYVQDDVL